MELWNKLFTNRRKNETNKLHKPGPGRNGSVVRQGAAPISLQKDGVRVLLFRECDTRGRKLLYDSKTVVQVPLGDAAPHAAPPAPKTLFKGSWGGAGGPSAQQHAQTKSPASARAQQKSETSYAEVSDGYGYQYQQKEGDTKAFAELVFGSVDLAYRGSCSKLHLLQDPPPRVLLSRTAPAPPSHLPRHNASSDQGIEDGSFSSSISSLGDASTQEVPWGVGGAHTLAMGVPGGLGSSISEGDSGFVGPPSPYSSTCGSFLSPPSLVSTPLGTPSSRQGSGNSLKNSGSLNSLQRRFLRNVNTSLEALGAGQDEAGGRAPSPGHPAQRRATKLGVAVIIQLQGQQQHQQQRERVEEWLFLHLGVIESCVNKLQSALHSAYLHRQTFVSSTHAAVAKLQQDLVDLVSGPRLCRPVWLGLLGQSGAAVAAAAERHALCTSFVDTLAAVLGTFDTKQTNFFVSKLLTAVLTHHLGWVSTVAPHDPPVPSSPPASPTALAHRPPFTPAQPSWAERLSESHPYSAVWAQLCELSGAVGYPPRAARTVLLGSDTSLLQHLLTILSYVIRCSQVVEQQVECPVGGPDVAPAVPRHLQAGSSQCSSAASIVTIVEEAPGTLQREASLRHSRRATRGGARTQEPRGMSDGAEEQPRQAPDQGGVVEKRWMLNDGEEIVIHGAGEGGRPPSPYPSVEAPPRPPDVPPAPLEAPPERPARTLKTCKTSSDLAALAGGEDEEEEDMMRGGGMYLTPGPPAGAPAPTPTPRSLYPALHHLDDHRETFGPVILEPGIIAEKVHKLFRGSPLRDPDPAQATQTPPQTPTPSAPSPQAPIPPPRTRRSISGKGEREGPVCVAPAPESAGLRRVCPTRVTVPAKDIHPEVEEGGGVLLLHQSTPPAHAHSETHIRDLHSRTQALADAHSHAQSDSHIHTQRRTQPPTHTQSETHIRTHKNQILPMHSQSDSHIHTQRRTQPPTHTHTQPETHIRTHKNQFIPTHSQSDSHIHTQRRTQTQKRTQNNTKLEGLSRVKGDLVTCLPHPMDTRRRVRSRNVGRESASDLTKLEADRTIYPTLTDLKEDSTAPGQGSKLGHVGSSEVTQTHRRHHSDPTNGVFTCVPIAELNVVEEMVERSHPHPNAGPGVVGVGVSENPTTSVLREEERTDSEGKEEEEKKEEEEGKKEEEVKIEEPVVIPMPRCVCIPTTSNNTSSTFTTTANGLVGSLLGGVLDHYASPFVLHATTQTQRWEDALRQDLSSAAHHSPLDPQLAEAVAVVADADSWEVQVVSSHSYVVGGGGGGCGGGLVGLRVDASPLVSSITDSVLDLTRLGTSPLFIVQHLEERLSELYLKSQLLAQYLLGGAVGGATGATSAPYHLPELTRALGLDLNDLPLLLAVASTHTPALTHMFGLCVR
ncbi:uncharacterized protein LOC126984571 [Eriocheir sinensis]|uniref:uncharacterized protein LOC126984571 n=1 Tax=Eriocheir sinensis TaxID=95602 RepID=UPI0021C65DE7|nr:uncharacterized protein LOC126984571 [Eriocheir sinensis]